MPSDDMHVERQVRPLGIDNGDERSGYGVLTFSTPLACGAMSGVEIGLCRKTLRQARGYYLYATLRKGKRAKS